MGKAITLVITLVVIGTIVVLILFNKSGNSQIDVNSSPFPEKSPQFDIEDFRFEKTENWGPCPQSETCFQKTILKGDGFFEREGQDNNVKFLSVVELLSIINKIKSTGIMEKECISQPVLDYSATYNIRLSDKQKEIISPGCQEELKEIEKLIPGVITN